MTPIRCAMVLGVLLLASACAPQPTFRQTAEIGAEGQPTPDQAVVIFADDQREKTSLRDVPQVGDVLFRRVDDSYAARPDNEFDFGIVGSVAADWDATFGKRDRNRMPRAFAIAPGTYVIDMIRIGSNATTIGHGYDPATRTVRLGSFQVAAGEVVNLGRLVVHMYWFDGIFVSDVVDDSAEARGVLQGALAGLAPKLQTRLLRVVHVVPFVLGKAR
jgi:hypothetical protein